MPGARQDSHWSTDLCHWYDSLWKNPRGTRGNQTQLKDSYMSHCHKLTIETSKHVTNGSIYIVSKFIWMLFWNLQGRVKSYVKFLSDWIKEKKFYQVVIVGSTFSHERLDYQMQG